MTIDVDGPFTRAGRAVFIAEAVRTPIGKSHPERGWFRDVHPNAMLAACYTDLIARAGIDPAAVEDLVIGCTAPFGEQSRNIGRNAWLQAGYPPEVPATVLDRRCGSAQTAVEMATALIASGTHDIVIAGGQENMSLSPHVVPNSRDGQRMGNWTMVDTMITDGLWDVYNQYHMGITAENVAKQYGISREAQDALALASQQKAAAAQDAGRFKDEIVPVLIPQKKGDPLSFDTDEFVNRKTNAEALAGLRPAFDKAGSVTAGNASGINDGAAAVMVMSAKRAEQLGLKVLGRIASYASAGLDPAIMGMGPVPAARRALERAGWKAADLDLLEINEAFAAQACAVHQEMGWDTSKVNVNGGAIAIGHPIGASGCRILVTLLHEMARRDAKKGIASLCIGGGMGVALTIER